MPVALGARVVVIQAPAAPTARPRNACLLARASAHRPPAARPSLLDPQGRAWTRRRAGRVWASAPGSESEPLAPLESASSSASDASSDTTTSTSSSLPGVRIDLGLPRRSRLVAFTCNKCDTRTERMVNPRAWESGMVFVQCGDPACAAWHKIADAAGLVEEIRFDTEDAPLAAVGGSGALEFEAEAEPHGLVVQGDVPVAIVPVSEGGGDAAAAA